MRCLIAPSFKRATSRLVPEYRHNRLCASLEFYVKPVFCTSYARLEGRQPAILAFRDLLNCAEGRLVL